MGTSAFQKYLAEFIGTFAIVFFGAGASVTNPTGEAITVSGGAPDFAWAGSFTKTNTSATGISVSGTGAGADIAFTADPDATPGLVKMLSTGTASAPMRTAMPWRIGTSAIQVISLFAPSGPLTVSGARQCTTASIAGSTVRFAARLMNMPVPAITPRSDTPA